MSAVWLYPTTTAMSAHAFDSRDRGEASYCRKYMLVVPELADPANRERARLCQTCLKKELKKK